MSDIRATLLKKFEARNPPISGIVFRENVCGGIYCIHEGHYNGSELSDQFDPIETLHAYNDLWKECQAAYAEAVRDCAEVCDAPAVQHMAAGYLAASIRA